MTLNRPVTLHRMQQTSINRAACVFLFPVILLLVIFIFYPILDTFSISRYSWNGISAARRYIGLDNWKNLIKDVNFWIAFKNNIVIMVLSLIIQIPLGVALAVFLDSGGRKFNIYKILWFIPMLMSSVAIGFLFTYVLSTNNGIISAFSTWLTGKNVDLLGNPATALYTVTGVLCWEFTPFYMVYFVAAFSGIPEEIFEAAVIDGATRNQYFWRISLPMIGPAVKTAAILSMVGSLKYFDLVYVMTGGGPGTATELMATYMYRQSFKTFNMGYGSAVAGGMFLLITIVSLITMQLLKQRKGA